MILMARSNEPSCEYYRQNLCRSCSLLSAPIEDGINQKLQEALQHISPFLNTESTIEPIYTPTAPLPSRAKAKMVVSGPLDAPLLGFLDTSLQGVDLSECPLHLPLINSIVAKLPQLITHHRLFPYDVSKRTGELKAVIISCNKAQDEAMVRFVLRSRELEKRVRSCALELQTVIPELKVVSMNIQPVPAAILEGSEEVLLTEEKYIWEVYGEFKVAFPPQAFMQVTPEVAEALYAQSRVWLKDNVKTFLDLFCGVGGFSFFAGSVAEKGYGIEITPQAIEAAQRSRIENGSTHIEFRGGSVADFEPGILARPVDTIIVNPPRRGLGDELIAKLLLVQPDRILYSSCNVLTWAKDMELLRSHYAVMKIKPFDMFPLTGHLEILSLLVRI